MHRRMLRAAHMQIHPAIPQHTCRLQVKICKQMLGLQQKQQDQHKYDRISQGWSFTRGFA